MMIAVATMASSEITTCVVVVNLIADGNSPLSTMLTTRPTAGITRMIATR
jgi:hypothetical protein